MPHGIPSGPSVLNPLVISVDFGHGVPHVGPTVPLGTFMQVGSQSVQQPGKQVDSDAWLEVINMSDSVLLPMFDTGIGPLEPIPVGWIWSAPIPISATQLTTTIIVQTAVQFFPNECIIATVFTRFDLETGHVPRKGPLVPSIPAAAIGPGPLPVTVTMLAEQVLSDATASPDSTFPGPNPYFMTPAFKLTGGMIPFELSSNTLVAILHQVSHSSVNYIGFEIQGSASASNGWLLTYTDSGGVQRLGFLMAPDGSGSLGPLGAGALTWDVSGNVNSVAHLQSGTTLIAGTSLTVTNAVVSVGGQASVGSFGVGVIVAETPAAGVTVAVTTLQTILSFSTPASPARQVYRVNANVLVDGTAAPATVTFQARYTDPVAGATSESLATWISGTVVTAFNAASVASPGAYGMMTLAFTAKASTTITVVYQSSAGVPNDVIDAVLERLI